MNVRVPDESTSAVRLADGRQLAFTDRGDPAGTAVIHNHGMPGSRLEKFVSDEDLLRMGIRLITPDRPGYGLSDRSAGGATGWASDVRQLADHLGLERFGVTAISGGGVYALAMADAMPDRVLTVALASSPASFNWRGAMKGMRFENHVGIGTMRISKAIFAAGARAVGWLARRNPGFIVDQANRNQPRADKYWLSQSWVHASATDELAEGLRHGVEGYVEDIAALSKPWPFDPSSIRARVELWHGDRDAVIPISHAQYLNRAIEGSVLHVCDGEGHMLIYRHAHEILQAATVES